VQVLVSVGITAHRASQAVADGCHVSVAGDHLYRMDYQDFVRKHRQSKADITVAALPMDQVRCGRYPDHAVADQALFGSCQSQRGAAAESACSSTDHACPRVPAPGSITCGLLDSPCAVSTFVGALPSSHASRPGNASVVKKATACQAFRLPQHGAG